MKEKKIELLEIKKSTLNETPPWVSTGQGVNELEESNEETTQDAGWSAKSESEWKTEMILRRSNIRLIEMLGGDEKENEVQ